MTIKCAAAPGHAGGQTLVELLASLGVAGVLLAAAVPSFQGLVLDSRRTAAVNELVATLLLARSEAIKHGQAVVVCGVRDANADGALDADEQACAGHDWSQGWLVGRWHDADADGVVDPGELTALRQHLADRDSGLAVTAGSFTATPPIAPAGTTVLKPFGQRSGNGTITVCDRRGPDHARGIIVAGSGRVRLASRKASGAPLNCPWAP